LGVGGRPMGVSGDSARPGSAPRASPRPVPPMMPMRRFGCVMAGILPPERGLTPNGPAGCMAAIAATRRPPAAIVFGMKRIFPIVLLVLGLLPACRSQPAAGRAETQAELRATGPIAAEELSRGREVNTTATLRVGEGAAKKVEYRVREEEGRWVVEIPGVRETVIEGRNGAQYVVSEKEYSESVATRYSPPLLLLPARLDMAEPAKGESQVTVTGLDGKPRESGSVTCTVRLLGQQRMRTGGEAEVYVVEAVRKMKLKLAEAEVRITWRYRPGRGLVEQEVDRQTRVLGLIPTRKSEELTIRR